MSETTNINQRLENSQQSFRSLSDAIAKSFKPIVDFSTLFHKNE